MKRKIEEKLLVYKVRTKQDPQAFGQLYDLYVEKIYRFVYFKINSKEEAEDIVSNVFLKIWSYLTEYTEKEIESFSGLIYRVARNAVVDFYRQRASRPESAWEENPDLAVEEEGYKDAEVGQEMEQLMRLIKKLKQEYQEVLLLKYVDDLSNNEISDILGKSKISVRVTLHRAVKKLKELSVCAKRTPLTIKKIKNP